MEQITENSVVTHNKKILHTDTGAEILGVNEESGMCFSLEGSGREIWNVTQTQICVADICALLRNIYAIDEAACLQQTLSFVESLVGQGLLDVIDPGE